MDPTLCPKLHWGATLTSVSLLRAPYFEAASRSGWIARAPEVFPQMCLNRAVQSGVWEQADAWDPLPLLGMKGLEQARAAQSHRSSQGEASSPHGAAQAQEARNASASFCHYHT